MLLLECTSINDRYLVKPKSSVCKETQNPPRYAAMPCLKYAKTPKCAREIDSCRPLVCPHHQSKVMSIPFPRCRSPFTHMSTILSYSITLHLNSLMSCLRNWLLLRVIWMRSTIHALDHGEEILLPRRPKGTAFPA